MKHKETAVDDFMRMIRQSWTWGRLTSKERDRFVDVLHEHEVFGSWDQRWKQLQGYYTAFLYGVGYQPQGWREPEAAPSF